MAQMSTGLSRHEKRAQPPPVAPLAVPPSQAAHLLSIGISRLYRLLRTGKLASYRDGRARRITTASIHEHISRRLAEDNAPSSRQRRSRRGLWQSGRTT